MTTEEKIIERMSKRMPKTLIQKFLKGCVLKVIEWPAEQGKDRVKLVTFSQKDYKTGKYVNISVSKDDALVLADSWPEILQELKMN